MAPDENNTYMHAIHTPTLIALTYIHINVVCSCVLRRQSRDTNRNIKRSVYCQWPNTDSIV